MSVKIINDNCFDISMECNIFICRGTLLKLTFKTFNVNGIGDSHMLQWCI